MSGRVDDRALLVVCAGVAAALHVGKLPTALPVLRDALGVTLVQAGFLLSLVQFAGMLFGVAVGSAADGLGLKRTMASGLALLALASALGSLAQGAPMLMLLFHPRGQRVRPAASQLRGRRCGLRLPSR